MYCSTSCSKRVVSAFLASSAWSWSGADESDDDVDESEECLDESDELSELADGIGFTVLAVGIFAISEVVLNLEQKEAREVFTRNVGGLMPRWEDLKTSFLPTLRGTAIGSFFGILPGTGPSISSFSSYMIEKKLAISPARPM